MKEPDPEWPSRFREPNLISLGLDSEDVELRALWRDALLLHGERFAAYVQLRRPALHPKDVLNDFAQRYVAAYETIDLARRAPLGALESDGSLERFEDEHGLEHGTVSWDYDALELFMRSGYEVVERPSGVYLFEKEDTQSAESVVGIGAHTDDPEILARWQEGVERWGGAFLAFATLRLPELHSHDVLASFEDHYLASFENLTELAESQIAALGWKEAFEQFKAGQSITADLINWDHAAIVKQLEFVCDVVWFGGRVHAFWK